MTRIAVVCVLYRSGAQIPALMRSLDASASTMRRILVDEGSPDDTLEVAAREAPEGDVLTLGANRGFSAGINAAVRHLRANGGVDVVVVLNPDVRPDPGSIDVLARALERSGTGVACPRLRNPDGTLQLSLRRAPRASSTWAEALLGGPRAARWRLPTETIRDEREYAVSRDVDWATGGFVALSWDCLTAVGPWREEFFMYGEEVDFAARARRAGFTVRYVPEAGGVRDPGPDEHAPWRDALMAVNRIALARDESRATAALSWAGLVVGAALRASAGRRSARATLWALLSGVGPGGVMRRLRPDAEAEVPVAGSESVAVQVTSLSRSRRRTTDGGESP